MNFYLNLKILINKYLKILLIFYKILYNIYLKGIFLKNKYKKIVNIYEVKYIL